MRVLLVEAPDLHHRIVADIPRARGHLVDCCEIVKAARAKYERERPDLVVLADIGPENLALCDWIRQTDQEDFVIVAAIVEPELRGDIDEIVEAGVDECFFGGLHPERLGLWFALLERRIRIRMRHAQIKKALREDEIKTRAILETSVDGIITINKQGVIETFNTAAEDIFGYAADEVVGRNVSVLMPPPYRQEHDGYIRNYLETGRRKIIGVGREVVGLRKDGSVFPLELAVSEVSLDNGRNLFTGMVRDISRRRRLEQEILRISEEEHRRIGQDLHDDLGQMLTGIGLITQNLARKMRSEGHPDADKAAKVTGLIKEADEYVHTLVRGLIPVDSETEGLTSIFQRLASGSEQLFGIRCTFTEASPVLIHDNSLAMHLYHIAQEAVNNAVKHGKAKHVKIILAADNDWLRLRIQDDGIGFPDTFKEEEEDYGMGVRIMRYRARIIGGMLEIGAMPGGGAILTCTFRHPDEVVYPAESP